VGEVFLRCNAKEVVERCGKEVASLARHAYGADAVIPEIKLEGHLEATFPYVLSHLEYIIGELLRNSVQAVVEGNPVGAIPPPIEITICEAPQHVIIRVSDQGGGIPREIVPDLWSFSKGPRSHQRLENLTHVPKMAATLQELRVPSETLAQQGQSHGSHDSSLSSLSSRPPNLRLGMGLPLSRIYAEYWAGSLEIQSLRGYGVDAFLQISKLGNKNEQLTTRASMDAV
jgi:pyruvate dehydrogenase kinase 2/3/4